MIRGGGDLGSGVAVRLHRSGFRLVIAEIPNPLAVRRLVSFSEAVYDGVAAVEKINARLIDAARDDLLVEVDRMFGEGVIPVLIDPDLTTSPRLSPTVVVDCRMRKVSPGPMPPGVPLVIGLGPGFIPGENCHAAVETNRGHNLGRAYWDRQPQDDTGQPDPVEGRSWERVLRAPSDGKFEAHREIGDFIREGEIVATVGGQPILAKFDGVLRGLLRSGLEVQAGAKVGDLDPRGVPEYCWTVSDKARAVGGGVLEAILTWRATSRGVLWT
ncbi:MAG TPA: selenium-dependent molybdenum cofactor biosynthesis protein YqeB [Anaerolineales bacterium]|nr:selenium-dependent molybdenum cofactor biosynthesis protein YqeB [Anaerolineales bacterium]